MSTLEEILDGFSSPRSLEEAADLLSSIPCPTPLQGRDYFGFTLPSSQAFALLLTRTDRGLTEIKTAFREKDFTNFWQHVLSTSNWSNLGGKYTYA